MKFDKVMPRGFVVAVKRIYDTAWVDAVSVFQLEEEKGQKTKDVADWRGVTTTTTSTVRRGVDEEGRGGRKKTDRGLRLTPHVLRGCTATLYAFLVPCFPVFALTLLACMRREAMP